MSGDDDWFERALEESESEDEAVSEDESVSEGESASESESASASENEGSANRDDGYDRTGTESTDRPDAGTWPNVGAADRPDRSTDDAFDFGQRDDTADERDASPFGEDFATAFENAPDLSGGDDFGFGSFDGGRDFGFEAVGGDSGAGGTGGSGGEPFGGQFDDDFESDIERIDIGIEGLDDMILGGVPKRSLMTAIGSAGTGKTTFGLQFLNEALRNGERAVYITLEESQTAIIETAEEKGWPFEQYEADDLLVVLALDPIEMANSLASIRNDLPRLIDEFGAERLVLDSVSLLEMMYDHPARRRSEVFDFTRALKEAGVTTMLTSEASDETPYASRYGIVEYLTDAVFVLQYVRPDNFRETRLAVEIQKIRDANHLRETKPYGSPEPGSTCISRRIYSEPRSVPDRGGMVSSQMGQNSNGRPADLFGDIPYGMPWLTRRSTKRR